MDYYLKNLTELIGKKITHIFYNKDNLRFDTEGGDIYCFTVYGDCCSHSEFWDFYGVKNLLGNTVLKVESIELDPSDGITRPDGNDQSTQYYGYRFTTESKEFGEVTSVFSFRNVSNGYYGGSLENDGIRDVSPEIFDDVTEAKD